MIANYHNIYYKNRIFSCVLYKKTWLHNDHENIINWVYDHIYTYLYKRKYDISYLQPLV